MTGEDAPEKDKEPEKGKVALTPEERHVLEGRAGRLRDYAKAAIDAGDWAATMETVGKIATIEEHVGGGQREKDRIGDVERALAALIAGMKKDGPHPHLGAVLKGEAVEFLFGKNEQGGLVINFAPLKAGRR